MSQSPLNSDLEDQDQTGIKNTRQIGPSDIVYSFSAGTPCRRFSASLTRAQFRSATQSPGGCPIIGNGRAGKEYTSAAQ